MKKIILSTMVLASVALLSFAPTTGKNDVTIFTVDAAKSKIDFTGSKTSDFHTGYFPVKSGSINVEGGKLVGGTFVIDVAGLKVTDGAGVDLANHLISAAFLDAMVFGQSTFTIKSVNYTRADRATVAGDLTLRGVKAPITFTTYIRSVDPVKGFFAEAFFPLDRTVFGVKYGVGNIDTDVQLAIHLYGK